LDSHQQNTLQDTSSKNPKINIYSDNRAFKKSGHTRVKDRKNTFQQTTPMEEDRIKSTYNLRQYQMDQNGQYQMETYELLDEKYKEHIKVYTEAPEKIEEWSTL
jgi:hypothetical protein